jgi:subtilisin-like proprotein convertase family protein
MKRTFAFVLLLWGAGALPLAAAITVNYSYPGVNVAIPSGNASGISLTPTVSPGIASITSVRVSLDISSDSNGSLYAYLSHNGSLSVLLNRTGRTAGNLAGYDNNGFNVTFDDSLINRDIHVYNTIAPPSVGSSLTGSWQTDARNLDPDQVLNTSSRNASLAVFQGLNADGAWTLFVAGLESGGTTTLNGWSMEITGAAVPESQDFSWAAGLLLLGFAAFRKWWV